MHRLLTIFAISAVGSGCLFYTDSINERPSLGIRQRTTGTIYRNSGVDLDAAVDDPLGHAVMLSWNVYICTDATPQPSCDPLPLYTGTETSEDFVVPITRIDGVTPVTALYVTLEGHDELGAAARPIQELALHVEDAPPTLMLNEQSGYGYVAGLPIDLSAKLGDPDDTAARVEPLVWQVFAPASQTYTLADRVVQQDPGDPEHLQFGKLFTPMGAGDWTVQVTATDPVGHSAMAELTVPVVPDHAPCLGQWAPITPIDPTEALPLTDPTLFQVLVVDDDLDPFPPVPSDPLRGTETFAWSILPPGATTRQALTGVTGNGVALDPASYTPGDLVELRVEIQDRNHTTVNCPDGDLTCSTISDSSCVQRLTWRVEVQ